MANSIRGFRFSGEYEDVFEYPNKGEYIYVCAEPWAWGYTFTATDYRSNGDGTYSCGSTYPVSIDQIAGEFVPDYQAPMDVAATIVGAEYARAFQLSCASYDEEPLDTMGLLDIAACHVLETRNVPNDVFEPTANEAYSDFLGKWEKAFTSSGVEF